MGRTDVEELQELINIGKVEDVRAFGQRLLDHLARSIGNLADGSRLFRELRAEVGTMTVRHRSTQIALLSRISALAPGATAEELAMLADAYLTLPAPDED